MSQNISLWGATYNQVPALDVPKAGGGTARFTDASITTAVESDVVSGKIFIKADGSQGTGTAADPNTHTVKCILSDTGYTRTIQIGAGSRTTMTNGAEYTFNTGDTIIVRIVDGGSIYYNGELVQSSPSATISYTFTAPSKDLDITCTTDKMYIVEAGAVTLQNKTVTPTESQQSVQADSGYDGLDTVTVNAISSTYVGTGITRRSSSDLTASGATVTVPSGYYSEQASKSVASGTAGTPTATKGTVSNHSVSVTPSVTNTTGYITGSTKTGTAVTVSASELVSGSETKTANGTYDVTNLASLVVNVSGGGGSGLTLLKATSLGTLSTSSTSASDTGKSMTVTGYNDYDVLIVDVSVDTNTNGRHTSTVSMVYLTGTSSVDTKNTYAVGSNKWNSKLSSSGTGSTRQSTTAYGIYVNSATVSGSTMTLTFYYRYTSSNTGTINGTYTARVYGVNLYDLIGG